MRRTAKYEVRPPANKREHLAYMNLERQSFADFGLPFDVTKRWHAWMGRENARVVLRDGQVLGGLGELHFAHWFGGRSIPAAGITAVAVAPEARGQGAATHLMCEFMRELHRRKVPLSTLYPSTWSLYRKAGYEIAGHRITYSIDLSKLGAADRTLNVRRATKRDWPAIHKLYNGIARRQNGAVDRDARQWERVLMAIFTPQFEYVIETPGPKPRIEGYFVYWQKADGQGPYEIRIRDLGFATPAAGRRLLTYLADHGTMASGVKFDGPPVSPLLGLAPVENLGVQFKHYWMLRVIDAAAALRQRGYPVGLEAEVHLEIADDVLPHNNGRLTLTIANGRGKVSRGGDGHIKCDIRGLAALFTGHASAFELQRMDKLDGPERDLEVATAVFAGPAPWMSDRF